ncbi:hypothetical protein AB1Y20_020413 [Prymnesium parvum]|uniref:C2H2-type domain-containing protein n=1 Tax=Prymnesium parvum TaxID=97485 RepID=A0AB34JTD1_PRYPA
MLPVPCADVEACQAAGAPCPPSAPSRGRPTTARLAAPPRARPTPSPAPAARPRLAAPTAAPARPRVPSPPPPPALAPPPPAAFPRAELLVVEGRSFGPVTSLASFKCLTEHLNDPACTIAAPSEDEAVALGVARCPSCSKFYHTIGPRPAIFNHFRHAGATDACRYPFRTEAIRALQARAAPGSYAFRAAAALGRHHGDPRTAAAAAARDAPPEPTPLPPRPAAPPASELIGPWLDSVSLDDARSLVVPGAGRHPSRTSAPAVYAALAPAYSYLAEHRHSALGVRAVLFRFLARCVIFASVPIADPAYPASAADRARAVLALEFL